MKLFQSIFGGHDRAGATYHELLIQAAIDRAVECTDPLIKLAPAYRTRLRAPVLRAIDHVVSLVDGLPAPLECSPTRYPGDARLGALFASGSRMMEVFAHDSELGSYLDGAGAGPKDSGAQVTAMLLAELQEKRALGSELVDGLLQREVIQVSITFAAHRLMDPSDSDVEMRRLVKRRAFDYLLVLALKRIAESKVERASLRRQRDLLRRKLKALEVGGWSFDSGESRHPSRDALQDELDTLGHRLAGLGSDATLLESHLTMLSQVLSGAADHLWGSTLELHLDAMNIQRPQETTGVQPIRLTELHTELGRRLIVLPVAFAVRALPEREDFVRAAERYLR